jgi:hypothetical protein
MVGPPVLEMAWGLGGRAGVVVAVEAAGWRLGGAWPRRTLLLLLLLLAAASAVAAAAPLQKPLQTADRSQLLYTLRV